MAQLPRTYAGFWRRTAAFLIDAALILVFSAFAGGLFVLLSNMVPQNPVTTAEKVWQTVLILFMVVSANACIAMIMGYFPILEVRFGQTLGKRLLHLRVLTEDGLPIGAWQAFLRRLSFYFEIFPIDALFVPFTARRQRGFDILAHTIVVEE